MLKEEVGKRLKECRKAAGFTQQQTADFLKMKQPSYARYEDGVLELDYQKMIALCQFFGVSSDFLLGLDTEK